MEKITWKTEKRFLSELVPWDKNPRSLSEDQAEKLQESLDKFGLVDPPIINTDNLIIGGHQRSKVMGLMEKFGNDAKIDVRVPSRNLTDWEVEELNIRLNKNTGSWDFDVLASDFNVESLMDWGFKPYELGLEAEEIDYDEIWEGMPEFDQKDEKPYRKLIVHFANERDFVEFSELVKQPLTSKTTNMWYPRMEREDLHSMGYWDDES